MKIRTYICIALLSAWVVAGRAQPASGKLGFLEVGKSYQIEFVSQSAVGNSSVQYNGRLVSGSIVKILKHEDSSWCFVELLRANGLDERTKAPRFKRERFWLNFGALIVVREATPEQAPAKDAIIE